jgi:hypothetical protein
MTLLIFPNDFVTVLKGVYPGLNFTIIKVEWRFQDPINGFKALRNP